MGKISSTRPAKPRYRITNWRDYNAALVGRGSVTLWIDEAVIANWHAVSGKGAVYNDAAIVCALSLRAVFGLALRQTQGFLESLARSLGLVIRIPHYSTLSRRAEGLAVPEPARLRPGAPVHLAVDATGLKVHGEGEWLARVHGASRRRVWRKLHLGVETATGEILAHTLTPSNCDDGAVLCGLLDRVAGPLAAVYGDKAYDNFKCHRAVLGHGATPVIPPKKGASARPPPRGANPPPSRGAIVRRIHQIGRRAWKRESGYHRRSLSETAMHRYKTILGPRLRARKLDTQTTEAAIGVRILNRFTALGMPETAKIV